MLSENRKRKNADSLGRIVKDGRTAAGYTQKAFADALGIEYYTMISQMELGYISIPAAFWVPIADKLNFDVSEWVLRCLEEYQPEVYRALFFNASRSEVADVISSIRKGQI